MSEDISIHARLGLVSAEAELEVAGISVSASDEALAIGIGGEIGVGDGFGVRLDWTRYDFDNGWDSLSIAGVARF